MKQKRTPRIPLTPEEMDGAHSALTGRPTLAESHGWTKEDYSAVDAAIDEQQWEQPKGSDPVLIRIKNRIDHNSKRVVAGREVHSRPRQSKAPLPTKPPQDLEGQLRKLKARVEDINRRLNTPTEVWSNPFGDGPRGHPMKLYGTPHLRQAAIEQRDRDEAAIKQIERMIRDRNRTAAGPDWAGQGIERMILAKRRPRVTHNKKPNFYAKDASYQKIVSDGHEYHLTPQAGAIVKVLHEAKGQPVTKADIQLKTKCGKISDSFRSLDGRKVWKRLIDVIKGRKGFYRLRLHSSTRK